VNLHRNWSPPYFFYRSNWPTDLESASRVLRSRWKFPLSLKLIRPSSYSVIAADTLRDLVTLTFDLLTLVRGHIWRVTWSIPPPGLKILRLSVLELWVLTSPIGYHCQCVCSHCASAVSRDLCVLFCSEQNRTDPDLPIHYTTFIALRLRQNGVIRQNSVWHCVKDHTVLCACAKSRQPGTLP